jgi:HIP---CoA ligase
VVDERAIPRTVAEGLEVAVERFGDVEAVVDGDVRLTYRELGERVRAVSRALLAAGVSRGDRVALWAPNGWEWIAAGLGATSIGALLVTLNTRFLGEEARDLLARSRSRVLVVEDGFLDKEHVAMLRGDGGPGDRPVGDLPELELVVSTGRVPDVPGVEGWEAFLARGERVEPGRVRSAAAAVAPGDPCDVIFTSGTTGRPKGAVCGHEQNLRTFVAWARRVGLRERDRYLMVNPFFHTFGWKAGILASLLHGATMLPVRTLDVDAVLRLADDERVTVLPGPPALYTSLLEHPDRRGRRLGDVRLAVTGAASVPRTLIERIREELGIADVVTAYGLTEVCGVATACSLDDDDETIATRCGTAIPEVEIRTVDASGRPVPAGAPGEVVVRGPNVMLGYLDDEEATADTIDSDGWLHTGDVGVLDERGYLRITDRLKDMFIVGGFNVYPAEVERALAAHPAVAEAAVVGVPDERLGEVGRAHVVPRRDATIDGDELLAWSRERLANYKVPRSVVVTTELPRNAAGKVLKRELTAAVDAPA